MPIPPVLANAPFLQSILYGTEHAEILAPLIEANAASWEARRDGNWKALEDSLMARIPSDLPARRQAIMNYVAGQPAQDLSRLFMVPPSTAHGRLLDLYEKKLNSDQPGSSIRETHGFKVGATTFMAIEAILSAIGIP